MNVEIFDQPKEMTLREVIDLLKKQQFIILSFTYGDFDNKVEVVVDSVGIDLTYTSFMAKSIFGPSWCMNMSQHWKYLSDVKRAKHWQDVTHEETSYSYQRVKTFEDVFELKLKVLGVVATF